MMKLVLLAALFAVASAKCPNDCSGHGTCGVNDACTCYTDKMNMAAFTGPDCSLRVCPKAKSWAAAPQANNNHEQLVECSNKGKCDRKGGECECHAGFTGEACDRTVCPNDCSGHGTCQSLKHFADDYSHDADDSMVSVQFGIPSSNPNTVPNTGAVYDNAWDATKSFGCKCDNGFQGADCSLRACPSGTDPLGGEGSSEGRECSGRGTCDFSSGLCNCFAGYFGEKCQTQNTIA